MSFNPERIINPFQVKGGARIVSYILSALLILYVMGVVNRAFDGNPPTGNQTTGAMADIPPINPQIAEDSGMSEALNGAWEYITVPQGEASKEQIGEYLRLMREQQRYLYLAKYKPELKERFIKSMKGLRAKQARDFPILRRCFIRKFEHDLWRENITATLSGKGNKTLNLVGGVFANNANVEDFEKTISESAYNLRFHKITYKWYKYDDEEQYYTLESGKDTDPLY